MPSTTSTKPPPLPIHSTPHSQGSGSHYSYHSRNLQEHYKPYLKEDLKHIKQNMNVCTSTQLVTGANSNQQQSHSTLHVTLFTCLVSCQVLCMVFNLELEFSIRLTSVKIPRRWGDIGTTFSPRLTAVGSRGVW
jgi:hypothetical protein